MKNWSVQQQERDGRWFIKGGDMLECDARYWFAKYCDMYPKENIRLCRGHDIIVTSLRQTWE